MSDQPSEDETRQQDGNPFESIEPTDGEVDPFTEVEVGDLDESEVWEALDDGEEAEQETVGPADLEMDVETTPQEAIVRKQSYCERCEYFSEPPEISCTAEGTEIRELVDMEHFRVYDCPIVEKRRGLGAVEE